MITKELLDFIKKSKMEGHTDDAIKSILVKNGWTPIDTEEAFRAVQAPPTASSGIQVPVGQSVFNAKNFVTVMPKQSSKSSLVFSIIILLLVAGAGSAFFFRDNLKTFPLIKNFFPSSKVAEVIPPTLPLSLPIIQNNSDQSMPVAAPVQTTPIINTSPVSTNTIPSNCDDNVDCLIRAAATCQNVSGTLSMSIPAPFLENFDMSTETKFEIKSVATSNCTLVFSTLASSISISDPSRKILVSKGNKSTEIDAEIQKINASLETTIGHKTTCASDPAAITSFLTDTKNHTSGSSDFSYKPFEAISDTTFITTSGLKLSCKSDQPPVSVTSKQ